MNTEHEIHGIDVLNYNDKIKAHAISINTLPLLLQTPFQLIQTINSMIKK